MKYKDKKKKRKYLWNESNKFQDELEKEIENSTKIKNDIIKVNLSERFNIIHDYSTEWETMEGTDEFVKTWQITIDKFPEKLIPYIKCNVIFELPPGVSTIPGSTGIHTIFETWDIPNISTLKKVNIISHFYLIRSDEDWRNTREIKVKLLIKFYNPQVFI